MTEIIRCDWVNDDPIYIEYHDKEWGIPEYNSLKLFENLCLEGQQAGLSWITVLKKREHYRQRFYHFDPHEIVKIKSIDGLLNDTGLIRHKLKLMSIINNAKYYLELEKQGENFSRLIWSFVNHTPVYNQYRSIEEVPTQSVESQAMSKTLKKKGFTFVGPTICYAFMQAMGLVNDHLKDCFCYRRA